MRFNRSKYGVKKEFENRPRNRKLTLIRLWNYITRYRIGLIIGFVLMIVANVLALIGPYLIGLMLDLIDAGEPFKAILQMGVMLGSFYLISAILNYLLSNSLVKISQNVAKSLRHDLFSKLTKIKITYYDENQTGDIIARMGYDIDQVAASIATDIMSFFVSTITVIVAFIMMLLISFYLTIIFFVTVPITVFVTRYLSKLIRKKLRERNDQLGMLNGYSEEMITGYQTIQSYVQEDTIYDLFKERNKETSDKMYEAGKFFTIVGPTVNFINNISTALVGILGTVLIALSSPGNVYITIGALGSFMLYARRFSGPINQMSNLIADIQSALAAAERVFSVIDQENEKADIANPFVSEKVLGNIKFNNVDFGYSTKKVLNKINFEIEQGKTLAIVGKTGSGKTTIINLLLRFYEIEQGEILLDSTNINEYARSHYRKKYAMILQEGFIFKGTIYENVSYGNNKSLSEVKEACRIAQIHDDIMKLPNGYDTMISDDSMKLSKGQQQLLSIARAFLTNSEILIFDEATSSVDTNTELLIQDAVNKLMKDKTSIIIAHRLSTIKNADRILLIDEGEIIENGSHSQLLSKKGEYYKLYNSQFD